MEDKTRAIDTSKFRRSTDEQWNPEAEISSHKMLYVIYQDVQILKEKVGNMEDMFSVWVNIKGSANAIRWIGRIFMWVSLFLGGIAAIWIAFRNK